MPTYRTAEVEFQDLLREVLATYHTELVEAGVTFGLLEAHAPVDRKTGEPKGPALKLHGYPCHAIVKINSHKDRVEGKPDATIVLDGDTFPALRKEQQTAVLDHEAHHIELARDEEGAIQTDDAGRPKLKMRLHDLVMGGFSSVVERHGEDAIETDHYKDCHKVMTQMLLPFG